MKTRDVREYKENGEVLVAVPLGPKAKNYAVIELIDYEMLKHLGLSMNWFEGRESNVRAAAAKAPSGYVSVARILVDAGEFERVCYQDGDKTNLRRGNISKIWHSRADMKRDRNFLSPKACVESGEFQGTMLSY